MNSFSNPESVQIWNIKFSDFSVYLHRLINNLKTIQHYFRSRSNEQSPKDRLLSLLNALSCSDAFS